MYTLYVKEQNNVIWSVDVDLEVPRRDELVEINAKGVGGWADNVTYNLLIMGINRKMWMAPDHSMIESVCVHADVIRKEEHGEEEDQAKEVPKS